MGRAARVTSIDALDTLSVALQRFRDDAAMATEDVDVALRRVLEWIHHDRKDYWTQELRRSWEGVSQAKLQLQQARTSRKIAGREPSCIDEQRALDRAKRRLEIAEQKVKAVQHWANALDHAADEFQQSRTRFANWLDTDLTTALAALDRMSRSLESYVSLATPSEAELDKTAQNVKATNDASVAEEKRQL
ncbi:MAG: hypothetical protein ABFC77_16555 [Thermoguttaceae bacterium]